MPIRVQKTLYFSILFFLPFILFLNTVCSSVYIDDSGETITVARFLGTGHPPGYPLHTLIGNLFLRLPLADSSMLFNLFSSLLAAVCIPLAALLFMILFSSRSETLFRSNLPAACAAGALWMALGPVFWANALVAKGSVYMLNNLFSICLMIMAGWWTKTHSVAAGRGFWLLLGLALAHHYMSIVVLLPAVLALAFHGNLKKFCKDCWLILPGLSVYLYLPLRSANLPVIDWAEIHSWSDFLFFLTRKQYMGSELTRAASTSFIQFKTAIEFMLREGHVFALVLGFCGLGWVIKKRHWTAPGLLLGYAVPLFAVSVYLNLEGNRLNIMAPYLFPVYLVQTCAGVAGIILLNSLLQTKVLNTCLLAAIALVLGSSVAAGIHQLDKSRYFFGVDNARNLLLATPRKSLLLASGDTIIFPLWYIQEVKGDRRDVAVAGTPVIPMNWVRAKLKRDHPDLVLPRINQRVGTESIPEIVQGLLKYNSQYRMIVTNSNQLDDNTRGWSLLTRGLVYQLVSNTAMKLDPSIPENYFKAFNSRGIYTANPDPRTEKLILGDRAVHFNSLGTWYEDQGQFEDAYRLYREAHQVSPGDEEFIYNLGNASFRLGKLEQAVSWYEKSLAINPSYVNSYFNLGVTFSTLGRQAQARAAFENVERLEPGRPEIRNFLSR